MPDAGTSHPCPPSPTSGHGASRGGVSSAHRGTSRNVLPGIDTVFVEVTPYAAAIGPTFARHGQNSDYSYLNGCGVSKGETEVVYRGVHSNLIFVLRGCVLCTLPCLMRCTSWGDHLARSPAAKSSHPPSTKAARSAIPDDRGRARGHDPMPLAGMSASAHFMSILGRSVPLVLALSRTLPVNLQGLALGRIFHPLFQYFPPSSSPFAPCQWSKHPPPPSPPASQPASYYHRAFCGTPPLHFSLPLFPRSLPTFPFPSSHIACAPSLRHHNTASLSCSHCHRKRCIRGATRRGIPR